MRVLITGSKGFLGKNLINVLDRGENEILEFGHQDTLAELKNICKDIDIVFHFGAIVRPNNPDDYSKNVEFTRNLLDILSCNNCYCPIVFSSSIQAEQDNPYGNSKRKEEELILEYGEKSGIRTYIFRFPNLFGKWARPNYTSVVATFCYNSSHNIPLVISNPSTFIRLAFVEEVLKQVINIISGGKESANNLYYVNQVSSVSLGELAYYIGVIRNGLTSQISRDDSFFDYLSETYHWYEQLK